MAGLRVKKFASPAPPRLSDPQFGEVAVEEVAAPVRRAVPTGRRRIAGDPVQHRLEDGADARESPSGAAFGLPGAAAGRGVLDRRDGGRSAARDPRGGRELGRATEKALENATQNGWDRCVAALWLVPNGRPYILVACEFTVKAV